MTEANRPSNERSAFERYILTERGEAYLVRRDEEYADDFVQEAWEAWQARAALQKTSTPTPCDADQAERNQLRTLVVEAFPIMVTHAKRHGRKAARAQEDRFAEAHRRKSDASSHWVERAAPYYNLLPRPLQETVAHHKPDLLMPRGHVGHHPANIRDLQKDIARLRQGGETSVPQYPDDICGAITSGELCQLAVGHEGDCLPDGPGP